MSFLRWIAAFALLSWAERLAPSGPPQATLVESHRQWITAVGRLRVPHPGVKSVTDATCIDGPNAQDLSDAGVVQWPASPQQADFSATFNTPPRPTAPGDVRAFIGVMATLGVLAMVGFFGVFVRTVLRGI